MRSRRPRKTDPTRALLSRLFTGGRGRVTLKPAERAQLTDWLVQLDAAGVPEEQVKTLDVLLASAGRVPFEIRNYRPLLFALVRAALRHGRADPAVPLLRRATPTRAPRDPVLRRLLARALYATHDYAGSLEHCHGLLRHTPSDIELLDLAGRNLLQLGRGVEATQLLDAQCRPVTPASTQEELALLLLRERAARESGRALELAKPALLRDVLAWSEARGEIALLAQAAWALGLYESQRGDDGAALHELARARRAWEELGDEFRCAEVQNSEAILWHRLGHVDEAFANFDGALARLGALGPGSDVSAAVRIVELNRADLRMDLEQFGIAAQELESLRARFGRGFLSLKCELMRLEALARLGSARDLVVDALLRLEPEIEALQRSALQAYFHRLRAWLARSIGDLHTARLESEREARCHEQGSKLGAWAEARARLAALQGDAGEARGILAAALQRTRGDVPLLLRAALALVRGTEPELPPMLPLQHTRVRELAEDFGRPSALVRWSDDPHVASEFWVRLCRIGARGLAQLPPGELADFACSVLGADGFVLRARRDALQWQDERIFGPFDPEPLLALEITAYSGDDEATTSLEVPGLASVAFFRDPEDQVRLTLVHATIPMRFGRRESVLACALCSALAERLLDRIEPAPAALPRRAPDRPAARLSGESVPMRRLRAELEHLVRSGLAIALTGETGVGKTRAGEHAHAHGPRRAAPLHVVHAAEQSEELAQSEWFGHEAGAFTGASHTRAGLLESAHGATLLIEGLDAMPPRLQLLLARALERKQIRRIGGTRERPFDVQILVTNELPLQDAMQQGRLRPELFYALGASELALLPLRERIEDLGVLLQDLQLEAGVRPRSVTSRVMRQLGTELWPGNVRELAARVLRALALANTPRDFGEQLLRGGFGGSPAPLPLAQELQRHESEVLRLALARHGGHRDATAQELGISRRWLSQKLNRYGLE